MVIRYVTSIATYSCKSMVAKPLLSLEKVNIHFLGSPFASFPSNVMSAGYCGTAAAVGSDTVRHYCRVRDCRNENSVQGWSLWWLPADSNVTVN